MRATLIEPEVTPPGFTKAERSEQANPEVTPPGFTKAERSPQGIRMRDIALPRKIKFGAVASPELRMRRPINLRISEEEGSVVAAWQDIDLFGYGDSLSSALEDFRKSITELFFFLESQNDSLAENLRRVKDKLGQFIERRPRTIQ